MALQAYAELHCVSNFSFLRGASHPEELIERACQLKYAALAITDECSVAGVVKAHLKMKKLSACGLKLKLLLGSEFAYGHCHMVAIAGSLKGWGSLCEFITHARREAPKGSYTKKWLENFEMLTECQILYIPQRSIQNEANLAALIALKYIFGNNVWLAAQLSNNPSDELHLADLQMLSLQSGVQLVAAGNVHMHDRMRKPLLDVITSIKLGQRVDDAGFALHGNAEKHLRHRENLSRIYPAEMLANTLCIAARCNFSLDEIRYNYPTETVPLGQTAIYTLTELAMNGAAIRYPVAQHSEGIITQIQQWLRKELELIAKCRYEMFFLTVHDIVKFARNQGILCQGRGSAANSVVCYCLGITAANPVVSHPLLERFISLERRNEPPDIDVDFEHERREEVIQYIYRKYGQDRAAIAAVVTCYRPRSALRDVGKALGLPDKLIDAFGKQHHWFDHGLMTQHLPALLEHAEVKVDPETESRISNWLVLAQMIVGFPRHLSQHVGGFVLTQDKLSRLVAIEPTAMDGRSVIQWEKDDLEAMGLMKIDVLALGMLSAIRRCLDLRNSLRKGNGQTPWGLTEIPQEDEYTYDMICKADTVGVFQIESRAQMAMLPRLLPRTFYDLVVEVAIVRPGPIAGGMVHPYLQARQRQRQGLAINYEQPQLKPALERTLGIPIFQEQVMQIAMIAAGFSASQADALRRSMAAWKKKGGVHKFYQPIIDGMLANGYSEEFAQRIFEQIKGFGEYGFPESHAYSFALITYASCWLKCHEPACFLAAMLNSQPLGFYTPSQLVQDAKRHGVSVLPPDVTYSDWDCVLHISGSAQPAVRLGLRMVSNLRRSTAERIVEARSQMPFANVDDLVHRTQIRAQDVMALAAADALIALAGHRRQQAWDAAAQHPIRGLLQVTPVAEARMHLPEAPEGEEIVADYAATGLTLRRHPLALLRPLLTREKILTAAELVNRPHGQYVHACGLVNMRQRPQTAKGTMFVTLEDETGTVNVIVWPQLVESQRQPLLNAQLLSVKGVVQRDVQSGGSVQHVIARYLTDMSVLLGRLAKHGGKSRDFR